LNKKGQIFSLDMMVATSLFIFILLTSITVWNLETDRVASISQRALMESKADLAMMTLLLTPGEPTNWYNGTDNFTTIGLISFGDYHLDPQKAQGLEGKNSSYQNVTRTLGVVPFDMYFRVSNESGTLYKFGVNISSTSTNVVKVTRLAYMDTNPVTVEMVVWNE
jgi:hypothetical protein